MDDYDRRRPDLQRAPDYLPRLEGRFVQRPSEDHLIADQMVLRAEEQDAHVLRSSVLKISLQVAMQIGRPAEKRAFRDPFA
jgi:hypothetical protein